MPWRNYNAKSQLLSIYNSIFLILFTLTIPVMETANASMRLMTVFFSRRAIALRSSSLVASPGTSGITSVRIG